MLRGGGLCSGWKQDNMLTQGSCLNTLLIIMGFLGAREREPLSNTLCFTTRRAGRGFSSRFTSGGGGKHANRGVRTCKKNEQPSGPKKRARLG